MANLFLFQDDLINLTGYKRPSDQRRWLTQHGWNFEVSATGKNIVLLDEAHAHLLSTKPRGRATEPDLSALKALQ
jgi:hypothetical protein